MRQATQLHTVQSARLSAASAAHGAPVEPVLNPERGRYSITTIGFPAERERPQKRVNFDPPRYARCLSRDGSWSTDCEVISVWENGARLRTKEPSRLDEFTLQFAWSPTVVSRRCKRVWCRGDEIGVEYVRTRARYSMEDL